MTTPGGLGGEQVEGVHAVVELMRAGRRKVHEVMVSADRAHPGALDEVVALADARGVRVRRVPAERIAAQARTEAPQGVIARAAPVAPADLDDLLAAPDAFLVALDGVTDPGNVGAVLRSAWGAGATGAILARHRGAHLGPAALKAAAGAAEHVPIACPSGIPAALDRARRAGVWSVGLDATSGGGSLFDLSLADQPLVLVLGSEGTGLARLSAQRCDVLCRIPLTAGLESLNVSAAAAVALFEVARRRVRPDL